MQNEGCPPPSFELQQPQLDDARASSMIAAAHAHIKAKVGCLSRTLGGVMLGSITEENHTTPITFNEASGRRCRSMPSLPANPTTRSSDSGLGIPVPISYSAPDLLRSSSRYHIIFPLFKRKKGCDGRYSPLSWMSFATLVVSYTTYS